MLYISLSLSLWVCYSISQRGDIVESAAALYGCENILTHRQRSSSDSFFCCCIMAGRNREVLLLELRRLTLISQPVLLTLQSHQTWLQQGGKQGFSQSSTTYFARMECEAPDMCSHHFVCLWDIFSTPSAHGSGISSFKFRDSACQVQYSTRKGGVFLCFVLTAPC